MMHSFPWSPCRLLPTALGWLAIFAATAAADEALPPVSQRFADGKLEETPDFQKHVAPLMGRLGCNSRACHGSFQGRGGFRLSLFGYDFKLDHDALLDKDSPRIDLEDPAESLILNKPTDADMHEGGLRYEKGSWQFHVFRKWIEAGAPFEPKQVQKLVRLEVEPAEILFAQAGERRQLKAVAVWPDGTREDVTPLCRFQSNNDVIVEVDEDGAVVSGEAGDTHLVVFYDNAVVPVPVVRPVTDLTGERYPEVPASTEVDRLVLQKLRKLGVLPSEPAVDAEFLRRVRLDLTGTLPTVAEVEAFLADGSPDKRARKIDALLKTPEYAAWWATRLGDWTGNNPAELNNFGPDREQSAVEWFEWLEARLAENTPYDQLVEGIVLGRSRAPGESYTEFCEEMSDIYRNENRSIAERDLLPHYWARRNFRMPEERAIGFAYSFLGVRIQCAQCHKHPFDQWSKEDFAEFQKFFTAIQVSNTSAPDARDEYNQLIKQLGVKGKGNQVRREFAKKLKEGKTVPFPEVFVIQAKAAKPTPNGKNRRGNPRVATEARVLGGEQADLTKFEDPREPLMDWLRAKDNPYFAKAIVNRVWASYFNVGIVEPPDDMSLANPPSNAPLLDHLAAGFVDSGYDLHWLHRTILTSDTYQRSWKPNASNRGDERNFARAIPRRLPAEAAYDAIQIACAADDAQAKLVRDVDSRAITSNPAGNANNVTRGMGFALTVFGRSTRENNCDCDRSMEASLLQTVYLRNDDEVYRTMDDRNGWLRQAAAALSGKVVSDRPVPEGIGRRIAQLKTQIEKLRERGRQERAEEVAQQLAALRKKFQPPQARVQSPVKPADLESLVRSAYLRTLSREPSPEETARAMEHVQAADDPATGLRDLLWVLLNTKEFIVNH